MKTQEQFRLEFCELIEKENAVQKFLLLAKVIIVLFSLLLVLNHDHVVSLLYVHAIHSVDRAKPAYFCCRVGA